MPTTRHSLGAIVLSALAAIACDGKKVTPTSPVVPAAATVRDVTISGLTTPLPVGSTAQLRLSATYSDGTQRDVTAEAAWQSTNAAVAKVSSTGLLSVAGEGDAEISGTYKGLAATARISVSRTRYRVTGRVHETEPTENIAVAGARVEVLGGSLNGYITTTDASGAFELPVVVDPGFRLKVTRSGYEAVEYGIAVFPRDESADIAMSPIAGPPPVARLDVHIDWDGSTVGILDFTQILFDATASTGANLRYAIDFGDGAGATTSQAYHACGHPGYLDPKLTVTDRFGRVSTTTGRRSVCIGLINGNSSGWTAAPDAYTRRPYIFFKSQTGAAVTGVYVDLSGAQRPFRGTLNGQYGISVTSEDGKVTLVGTFLLKDSFGDLYHYYSRHLIMTMKGGDSDGLTLNFSYYEPY